MYAGRIRLIGTETGVGVRNAGELAAQAGMVTVTVDGRIENSGAINSSSDTRLAGNEVINSGKLFAGGNSTVKSTGDVRHSGLMAASGDISISAGRLTSTKGSILAAGLLADGRRGVRCSGWRPESYRGTTGSTL